MTGTTEALDVATEAANSRPMGWLARAGLTARGVVYLVMGWLAILVAMGARAQVDPRRSDHPVTRRNVTSSTSRRTNVTDRIRRSGRVGIEK